MKAIETTWAVAAVMVAASWSWTLPVEAATKAEQARAAAKLVDDTLRREATEGIEDRAELLKPALERASPCEAAYWQSGFLYDQKQREWLRWDEAQQRSAQDKQLAAYREIRPKYRETEGGQTELARWCAKRKLDDQARAHWTKVLSLAPDQLEARRQLGFQMVNGTWLSRQEIADAKQRANNIQAALHRWTPKLEDLRKRLEGSNRRARELAHRELTAIKDPDVVPAIEAVFCSQGSETALLGIELLKDMQAAEAAQSLAWQAVFSPWEPIRAAATAALKEQRKHDYVPPLLGAMRTPIQARYDLYSSPDGGFLMRRALYQDGPEKRELAVLDVAHPAVFLPSGAIVLRPDLQTDSALQQEQARLNAQDQQRQLTDLAVARDGRGPRSSGAGGDCRPKPIRRQLERAIVLGPSGGHWRCPASIPRRLVWLVGRLQRSHQPGRQADERHVSSQLRPYRHRRPGPDAARVAASVALLVPGGRNSGLDGIGVCAR